MSEKRHDKDKAKITEQTTSSVDTESTNGQGFTAESIGASMERKAAEGTFGPMPYQAKDEYKPEDYRYERPSGRFEQPKKEVELAEVAGEPKLRKEDILRVEQRSREESKTLYGAYILREWKKDPIFSKYKGVNFEAIIQASNISEGIAAWVARKKSEWDAQQRFPTWLLDKGLTKEDLAALESATQSIGVARREKSHFDFKLSEHRKKIADRIQANFEEKIYNAFRKPDKSINWLVVLSTWTIDKLPYDDIFDIVTYQTLDAKKSLKDIEAEAEAYVSPSMYADTVLDKFRKEFFEWVSTEGNSGIDFLKSKGISDFIGKDRSQGNGDLSDISESVLGIKLRTT